MSNEALHPLLGNVVVVAEEAAADIGGHQQRRHSPQRPFHPQNRAHDAGQTAPLDEHASQEISDQQNHDHRCGADRCQPESSEEASFESEEADDVLLLGKPHRPAPSAPTRSGRSLPRHRPSATATLLRCIMRWTHAHRIDGTVGILRRDTRTDAPAVPESRDRSRAGHRGTDRPCEADARGEFPGRDPLGRNEGLAWHATLIQNPHPLGVPTSAWGRARHGPRRPGR